MERQPQYFIDPCTDPERDYLAKEGKILVKPYT